MVVAVIVGMLGACGDGSDDGPDLEGTCAAFADFRSSLRAIDLEAAQDDLRRLTQEANRSGNESLAAVASELREQFAESIRGRRNGATFVNAEKALNRAAGEVADACDAPRWTTI